MITVFKIAAVVGSLVILFIITGCISAGGTDVDTASIKGTVTMDGQPVAKAGISLMSPEYNPVRGDSLNPPLETVSDGEGNFHFRIDAGTYSLEARHPTKKMTDWKSSVKVMEEKSKEIALDLKKSHVLVFKVPDDMMEDNMYIYIPGSSVYGSNLSQSDSGQIILENVPHGEIDNVMMGDMDDMDKTPEMFKQNIPMFMDDTLYVN